MRIHPSKASAFLIKINENESQAKCITANATAQKPTDTVNKKKPIEVCEA